MYTSVERVALLLRSYDRVLEDCGGHVFCCKEDKTVLHSVFHIASGVLPYEARLDALRNHASVADDIFWDCSLGAAGQGWFVVAQRYEKWCARRLRQIADDQTA